jgi:hypothetical protein
MYNNLVDEQGIHIAILLPVESGYPDEFKALIQQRRFILIDSMDALQITFTRDTHNTCKSKCKYTKSTYRNYIHKKTRVITTTSGWQSK